MGIEKIDIVYVIYLYAATLLLSRDQDPQRNQHLCLVRACLEKKVPHSLNTGNSPWLAPLAHPPTASAHCSLLLTAHW